MKRRLDDNGFSLVELIIVFAIMAILTGSAFSVFGYINNGNVKKCSRSINSGLNETRTANLTREGNSYLYIYKYNGDIYKRISKADDLSLSGTGDKQLDDSGERIGNKSVHIIGYYDDASGKEQKFDFENESDPMIKISFRKGDGGFSNSTTFYKMIEVKKDEGAISFVHMVKETGRFFIEN